MCELMITILFADVTAMLNRRTDHRDVSSNNFAMIEINLMSILVACRINICRTSLFSVFRKDNYSIFLNAFRQLF